MHDSAEIMAAIVAKRLVEDLDRCGFVILKTPPIPGSAPGAVKVKLNARVARFRGFD